ncbi:hypothetical protein MC885_002824, partial [Smutsia gigantea]
LCPGFPFVDQVQLANFSCPVLPPAILCGMKKQTRQLTESWIEVGARVKQDSPLLPGKLLFTHHRTWSLIPHSIRQTPRSKLDKTTNDRVHRPTSWCSSHRAHVCEGGKPANW